VSINYKLPRYEFVSILLSPSLSLTSKYSPKHLVLEHTQCTFFPWRESESLSENSFLFILKCSVSNYESNAVLP
jgi:hypothetical protein